MSTWLYLECLDHDPPLESPGESGQHLYDLPQIRADIADREHLVARYESSQWDREYPDDDFFRKNSIRFLAAHPRCRIGIRDEYGREHPVVEP